MYSENTGQEVMCFQFKWNYCRKFSSSVQLDVLRHWVIFLVVPPSLAPFLLLLGSSQQLGPPQSPFVGLHSNLCWISQAWATLAAQCWASASFSLLLLHLRPYLYSLPSSPPFAHWTNMCTIIFRLFFSFCCSDFVL